MTTIAHSPILPATKSASKYPRLGASLIDRATALALRRTTMDAPTICTQYSRVPIVIVPPSAESAIQRSKLSLSGIKHGLSWMAAVIVALAVPLAMAIPLELLSHHG